MSSPSRNVEVLIRRRDEKGKVRVAVLHEGGTGGGYLGHNCDVTRLGETYAYGEFSEASWFGDDDIHDDWGNPLDDDPFCARRSNARRPWLPLSKAYFHYLKKEDRLEIHLGIKWGGKEFCARTAPMSERDILAFLEKGLVWKEATQKEEEGSVLTAPRGRCWERTSTTPMPYWGRRSYDGDSGWTTYELSFRELRSKPSNYTFLVDLYEKKDGSLIGSGPVLSFAIQRATLATSSGVFSLPIEKGDSTEKLDRLNNATIVAVVTAIERKTGKQAILFVGDMLVNKALPMQDQTIEAYEGYTYFDSFLILHYFSSPEVNCKAIWPETFLRLQTGTEAKFELGFYWMNSEKNSRRCRRMEWHLVSLFLGHGVVSS